MTLHSSRTLERKNGNEKRNEYQKWPSSPESVKRKDKLPPATFGKIAGSSSQWALGQVPRRKRKITADFQEKGGSHTS